jgi:hypothetical protein
VDTATVIQQVLEWLKNVGTFVVENGWRIAMRQVYLYGFLDLVWFIILSITGASLLIPSINYLKDCEKNDNYYDPEDNPLPIFGIVFGGVFITLAIFIGVSSIRWFVNPEWYAIKLIIDQVK